MVSAYKNNCIAPFVKNTPLQLQTQFIEEYYIKANDTLLVIVEIQGLYINDELLENDGFINLSKVRITTINGFYIYNIPVLKKRLKYQRPK